MSAHGFARLAGADMIESLEEGGSLVQTDPGFPLPHRFYSLIDMQRLNAALLLAHAYVLSNATFTFSRGEKEKFVVDLKQILEGLLKDCVYLGWEPLAGQIERMLRYYKGEDSAETNRALSEPLFYLACDLRGAIQYELLRHSFYCIPNSDRQWAEEARLSQNAQDRFPDACYDSEEAVACFVFGRHNASVFHLMRVLEHGLVEFAKSLGIAMGHENWTHVIEDCETQIEIIRKNTKRFGQELQQFYSEAALEFRYFKHAWRNFTMHRHSRYTRDDAKLIFIHVKAFIEHMETGLPTTPVLPL